MISFMMYNFSKKRYLTDKNSMLFGSKGIERHSVAKESIGRFDSICSLLYPIKPYLNKPSN